MNQGGLQQRGDIMDDKRHYTRVTVPFDVTLDNGKGPVVRGALRDIAVQGAFVACAPTFAPGTMVDVDIALHGGVDDIHVQAEAEVVHQEAGGLGIHFTAIDLDSITHLRNLIAYNARDADEALGAP